MKNSILKLLVVFAVLFGLTMGAFTQNVYLPSDDSDYDALDTLEEEEADSLVKKYDDYISRIRKGDRNVLRLMVFEEFEAVHERIKNKTKDRKDYSYYDFLGKRGSLPAYFAGFQNQDPKVRLKCIGFLADYVDEVRDDYSVILQAVQNRLKSGDETRREVEFALKILRAKIVRRRWLERVRKGDMSALRVISPNTFLLLVANQRRLQIEWCYESDVAMNDIVLRSINFDYFNYETNKRYYMQAGNSTGNPARHGESNQRVTDGAGSWKVFYERLNKDYLTRTVDFKVKNIGDPFNVGEPFSDIQNIPTVLRALLAGLSNKHLFVREECAFVFLDIVNDRRYDSVRYEELKKISRNPALTAVIKAAFDEVLYSYYEWTDYYIGENRASYDQYVPLWTLDFRNKPEVDLDFRTRPNYVVLLKLIMNKTDLEWYHSCEVESQRRTTDLHVRRLFDEEDRSEWRIDELSGERGTRQE